MTKVIFVYNAKSDIINATFDFAHKIISPNTYACNLCKLTHSNFGERETWKKFKQDTNLNLEFLHIDEFENRYSKGKSYPLVLRVEENKLEELLSSEDLNHLNTTEELITALTLYLK